MKDYRIDLPHAEMPDKWYNVAPDLPRPLAPPLHPGTGQPIGPGDLAPIFPMGLIMQEVSQDRWIEIPDEVLDAYRRYRPSPLYRAYKLEKALDTPAHIYYKYEGVSPAGSHKPNTALAQAYYNKQEGVKRLATETGAGQWGSALAWACSIFGLELTVYMVRVSYDAKPGRRMMGQCWGAEFVPSPSHQTEFGRSVLAQDPNSPGSLGIAISEALEDCVQRDDTRYSLGSVLNHVMIHQSIIGLEAKKQMEIAGEYPDVLVACVGGGSNFAGLTFPFVADKLAGKTNPRLVAVEPTACPTLTRAPYAYDFGDTKGMTPLLLMHTLGHTFMPAPFHAGGLRYHGAAPEVSLLLDTGVIEANAVNQVECFEAAVTFARSEGFIPAPESAHAIRQTIIEAEQAKQAGEARVILFNLSGHGLLDLTGYESYFAGHLPDYTLPQEDIDKSLGDLPCIRE
jgi:tryptophan synthase beta chain